MSELKFLPIGSFILIKPLGFKYVSQTQTVLDDEKNEGKNPIEDEMEVKTVVNKVKLQQQLAKVLSIGTLNPEITPYKVGDTIVYDLGSVRDFELIKGSKLIYSHNVLGVWQG